MKKRFKSACGLLFFFAVRAAERLLSVRGLHRILNSFAFVRAVVNTAFKKVKRFPPLPDFLRTPGTRRTARQSRQNRYLNHFLEFFPERLAETEWMDRCRIEGLDRLLQARQGSRPVVLAFCHFGSYFLLRFWLRAAGFPAATFVGGNSAARAGLTRFEDRFSPFPEIPTAFYQDQLRAAVEFLAARNPLLVSIDMPVGKQMNVPFGEGWTFRMATGAIRLAIRHRAELIPCSIVDEGRWRFHIELGRPVPEKLLAADADWVCAGKHLLDEQLPRFRNHPRQCLNQLIECFQPAPSAVPMGNHPDELLDPHQFKAR
jgi:hypothetical protein